MTEEVKSVVEGLGTAFEEFKKANDERLANIEKNAKDPLVEAKLAEIEKDLDRFEDINQKLVKAEMEQKNVAEKLEKFETMLKRPEAGIESKSVDMHTKAFDKYLRKGKEHLDEMEIKALTVGTDATAGYLAPVEYVRELLKTIEELTPFRQVARVRATTQKSIEIPSRDATFAAAWVAETGTRSETTGYTTSLKELAAYELYALVDISEQLLEDAVFDIEAEMNAEFAEQFAKAEGAAFINGTGSGQPEGVLTNASVATVNSGSASELTADGLIELVHSIKSDYASNGIFMFNRSTLAAIRKLKDSAGQYVFQAGMQLQAGVPNTILGHAYVEAPDMPNIAAAAKPVAFGDFGRGYMILDRVNLSIMRDPFTRATSGNIRYIARRRVGGEVIQPEAIITQTIAS